MVDNSTTDSIAAVYKQGNSRWVTTADEKAPSTQCSGKRKREKENTWGWRILRRRQCNSRGSHIVLSSIQHPLIPEVLVNCVKYNVTTVSGVHGQEAMSQLLVLHAPDDRRFGSWDLCDDAEVAPRHITWSDTSAKETTAGENDLGWGSFAGQGRAARVSCDSVGSPLGAGSNAQVTGEHFFFFARAGSRRVKESEIINVELAEPSGPLQ